jgi:hypothetical protein
MMAILIGIATCKAWGSVRREIRSRLIGDRVGQGSEARETDIERCRRLQSLWSVKEKFKDEKYMTLSANTLQQISRSRKKRRIWNLIFMVTYRTHRKLTISLGRRQWRSGLTHLMTVRLIVNIEEASVQNLNHSYNDICQYEVLHYGFTCLWIGKIVTFMPFNKCKFMLFSHSLSLFAAMNVIQLQKFMLVTWWIDFFSVTGLNVE